MESRSLISSSLRNSRAKAVDGTRQLPTHGPPAEEIISRLVAGATLATSRRSKAQAH